jgi:3-phosphoshikimate 1-carboxyvinyltransferase
MREVQISKKSLHGEIIVPGDKSISHRSIMFSSLSNGKSRITGFLNGADCISTIGAFREMGVNISEDKNNNEIIVQGVGLHGLKSPSKSLDMGNSGTTTRLISGILVGQKFESELYGDESLSKRPMRRIIEPLNKRHADISSKLNTDCLPLIIKPSVLSGIDYKMPVSSAQVKSCILLSGLYSSEKTIVREEILSRNHTELMLKGLGCDIDSYFDRNSNTFVSCLTPGKEINALDINIPSDISSAAYFMVAGLITDNSEITMKHVNLNDTRSGIIKVIQRMGGYIEINNKRIECNEPVGDITVKSSSLHGTIIEKDIIPSLIDEIPVISVLAAFCNGTTIIKDASELRVKESDRIEAVTNNLKEMGCDITATSDGMIINGGNPLHGINVKTYKDHRIAMAFSIAGLAADGITTFDNSECVNISYPSFYSDMKKLYQ